MSDSGTLGPQQAAQVGDAAIESAEFDFEPYKTEVVKLWREVIRLTSGRYEEVEARTPQVEARYDEIVRLSAEALIASGGEIVEPYNILKAPESKGVFRALRQAFVEASSANPTYCMPAQSQELNFTRRIASEAVKILLARQKGQAQAAVNGGQSGSNCSGCRNKTGNRCIGIIKPASLHHPLITPLTIHLLRPINCKTAHNILSTFITLSLI